MKKILFLFSVILLITVTSCTNCLDYNSDRATNLRENFPIGSMVSLKVNGQNGVVVDYDLCPELKVVISILDVNGYTERVHVYPWKLQRK